MKQIQLTQGKAALVDDKDFEYLKAARAYDEAAKRLHGEFARTNF